MLQEPWLAKFLDVTKEQVIQQQVLSSIGIENELNAQVLSQALLYGNSKIEI